MNTVKLTSLDYAYEPGPTAPVPVFSGSIGQLSILGKMDMNSIGEIFVGKSSDIIFDNSAKILTERPYAAMRATETIGKEDNYYFPVSEADKNIIMSRNYDALYLSVAPTLGAGYTISAKIKAIEQSSASSSYYVTVEPADGRAFKTEIPTDTAALTGDEDIVLLTEDTPVYKYIRPFRTTSFSITAGDEALTNCLIRTRTSDRIIQAEKMDVVTGSETTSMPVFTVPETEFHILFENNENIELRIISGRFTDIDLYGSAIQSFIGYNTPETAIALNTACFSLTDCPNIRLASISTSDESPELSENIKIKKLICPGAVYFNTNEFNYYN